MVLILMSQLALVIHVVHPCVHHVVHHAVALVAFLQGVRILALCADMMEVMHIPVGTNRFFDTPPLNERIHSSGGLL